MWPAAYQEYVGAGVCLQGYRLSPLSPLPAHTPFGTSQLVPPSPCLCLTTRTPWGGIAGMAASIASACVASSCWEEYWTNLCRRYTGAYGSSARATTLRALQHYGTICIGSHAVPPTHRFYCYSFLLCLWGLKYDTMRSCIARVMRSGLAPPSATAPLSHHPHFRQEATSAAVVEAYEYIRFLARHPPPPSKGTDQPRQVTRYGSPRRIRRLESTISTSTIRIFRMAASPDSSS